jgi:protoporphyrinogen oxidase
VAQVVILGAGLTGLCTAYHLEKNNFFDFKIFEKNNIPGGLLRSFEQEGFTFDFTGHLLHINNNQFWDFINATCDIKNFTLNNRHSAIYLQNTLTPYPFQINLAGLPNQIIIDSIYGFINRKAHIKKPKNFYDWVLKYFGSGMGKYFFFPYNQKILSYDIKKIKPEWTGRFVPQTNLKTILNATLCNNPIEQVGYNTQFYYPKIGGIEFLINEIIKNLRNNIYTNHSASVIDTKNKIITFENGTQEKYNLLINTIPLDMLLKSLQERSDSTLKRASSKLLCNSVINFNLGFNVEELINKSWIYFPEKKYNFYRIGFWHNISKTSVKKNCTAIYGELSYMPNTKTQKQIQNNTQKSIQQTIALLKLKKSNIITEKILHIPHAYVIYDFWREKNLKKILEQLKQNYIYSIGRYGEWKYASMQEAFLDGKKAAEEILEKLNTTKQKNIIPAFKYIEKRESYIKQKEL